VFEGSGAKRCGGTVIDAVVICVLSRL
jgi:hypothetical protein